MAKFNFRSSSGYVTDASGETYVLNDAHPTTRDSLTFGYDSTTGINTRDRDNSGTDTRYAGEHYINNNQAYSRTFIYECGNGSFDVGLCAGPHLGTARVEFALVALNSSNVEQRTITTYAAVSNTTNKIDINGTAHTTFANWASNSTTMAVTLSGAETRIGIKIGAGDGTTGYATHINHFSVESASAPFAIDSTDASMQRSGTFDVVCSNPATTPTTGNSTLSNGGDTLTCTGVTGTGPYTLTFSVGDLTKQVDATGYDWTLTVDAETDTTGNIPLTIQAGYTKVDLTSPVTTNGSLLYGYTGDTPVTGDDLEYDVTSTLDSGVSFSVATDGVWTVTEAVDGDWVTDITVDRRVVQANGTIGTTAEITLSPAVPTAPTMPADTSVNVAENSTTVGTFTASSGSATITYSLSGTDAASFSINSSTGAVTFNSAPDYEADALSYSITVTATNSEGSDSQNITVNVTNVVETPVLATTLGLSGTVDSTFSRTLSIQSGDAATSWTITGGADQASYTISNAGLLSRTSPNAVEEDEVVTVTASNAAGTSNTQTVTITYVGGIVIPTEGRQTFQAMVGYLITQGYQGAGNETIQKWLIAEGISKKSFNEMLRDYLTSLGYNGTLPEQLRDWRNG